MYTVKRKQIDREATGRRLQVLRLDNDYLRRYVCSFLNYEKGECDGNCDECDPRDSRRGMDLNISQRELAEVFGVGTSVIANWENGRSLPPIEDLMMYGEICRIDWVADILVFEE